MVRQAEKPVHRRLDTRVEIYAPPAAADVAIQNGYGEVANDPTITEKDWVGLDFGGSTDAIIGGQVGSLGTVTAEMRLRTDLTIAHRLKILNGPLRGLYLYIAAIAPTTRGRIMKLNCRLAERAS